MVCEWLGFAAKKRDCRESYAAWSDSADRAQGNIRMTAAIIAEEVRRQLIEQFGETADNRAFQRLCGRPLGSFVDEPPNIRS